MRVFDFYFAKVNIDAVTWLILLALAIPVFRVLKKFFVYLLEKFYEFFIQHGAGDRE